MKTQPFNILLADDEPTICLVVETLLKRRGNTVKVASNGREAIELFSRKPDSFDLLITDHSMPMVTGLELVQYLHKHGFHGKIIVISGSLTAELEAAYNTAGVDAILQKPFTVEGLASTLDDLFRHWEHGA